ncbi:hypothetical protein ACWCN4_23880, partial [Rhodococcus ruber]
MSRRKRRGRRRTERDVAALETELAQELNRARMWVPQTEKDSGIHDTDARLRAADEDRVKER